jgi:hypothetical protein
MTPFDHAILSSRDFGGEPEDYLEIHLFIDSSKLYYPFWMHRMFTHNSFFIGIVERVFGSYIEIIRGNFQGKIPVRRIAEEHIKQDLNGFLPSMQNWIDELKSTLSSGQKSSWMNCPKKSDLEYLKNYYEQYRR